MNTTNQNNQNENLQKFADEQGIKVKIGVIEPTDTPNYEDVLHRLKSKQVTNILLAPILFNGGSHVSNDIAGGGDSWKTRLIEAGFNVRICTEGLGSFESFRQLYIDKLKGVI